MTQDNLPCEVKRAVEALAESLDAVTSISDEAERMQALSYMAKRFKETGSKAAQARAEVAKSLYESGYSYEDLAALADVTKPRIQQILGKSSRPQRHGRIEHIFAIQAAELRGRGLTGLAIAIMLVPAIRKYPGGQKLSHKRIANILQCDVSEVAISDQEDELS